MEVEIINISGNDAILFLSLDLRRTVINDKYCILVWRRR
jgi:hypothetical protein